MPVNTLSHSYCAIHMDFGFQIPKDKTHEWYYHGLQDVLPFHYHLLELSAMFGIIWFNIVFFCVIKMPLLMP